jgi:hypothetical protein
MMTVRGKLYLLATLFLINFVVVTLIEGVYSKQYLGSAISGYKDSGSYYLYLLDDSGDLEVSREIWRKILAFEIYGYISGALAFCSMAYIFISHVITRFKKRTKWMDR